MLKVGDKVICIKRGKWEREDVYPDITFPRFGHIDSVRSVDSVDGCILLEGIVNGKKHFLDGFIEPHFDILKFRKIEAYTAKCNEVNFNFIEEGLEKLRGGCPLFGVRHNGYALHGYDMSVDSVSLCFHNS